MPTSLASSTAPAQIRSLPNGHLLAVWNQHSAEEIVQGYTRTRLSTAISRNGGSLPSAAKAAVLAVLKASRSDT